MTPRRALRLGLLALSIGAALSVAAPAAGAATGDPASYEYHAVDLLEGGSVERAGASATLVLDGRASEGDTVEIAIDETERDAFDITAASATAENITVETTRSADAVEIELIDLGGKSTLSAVELSVAVDVRANETIVGGPKTDNATTVGRVVSDDTGSGLVGEGAITASVAESGTVGISAEDIDFKSRFGGYPVVGYGHIVLSFKNNVTIADGDSINISVDPNAIATGDEGRILLDDAYDISTQSDKISNANIYLLNKSGVLNNSPNQIKITFETVNDEPQSISETGLLASIILGVTEKPMRSAAARYHRTDLFEVDVEGENNAELTDNADIRTDAPVLFDIHPGEVEEFALGNVTDGSELGVSENRSIDIETASDEFGNEVRKPVLDATLTGAEGTYTTEGVTIDTADRNGIRIGRNGDVEPPLGVFDVTLEITDIEGPNSHAPGAVTETIENVTVYPDNVTVSAVGPSRDFDADGGTAAVAVDLGAGGAAVDRLDLELRRTAGSGTVTFDRDGGAPTPTAPWEGTDYGGDGELGSDNVWALERNLTAEDFDDGVRTYVLKADAPDRYRISVEAMPYEGELVPDATAVRSSTRDDHGGSTRDDAEIVATGPITNVAGISVRTDHEFVGTETDPGGNVTVEFGAFRDANGNPVTDTSETVTVGFGNETVAAGPGGVTREVDPGAVGPNASVEFDPTAIDAAAIETGTNATVAVGFEGHTRTDATGITFVHRVREPGGSAWTTESIPQPATVRVDADGARDLARWNATTDRYESVADTAEGDTFHHRHIEAKHLHSGLYFRAADEGARLGFAFVTDDEAAADLPEDSASVELDDGWHLGSSNYDTSANASRELSADLVWAEYGYGAGEDAFVVRTDAGGWLYNRTNGTADGTAPIGTGQAYWIRVDREGASLVRDVVSPTFAESGGGDDS